MWAGWPACSALALVTQVDLSLYPTLLPALGQHYMPFLAQRTGSELAEPALLQCYTPNTVQPCHQATVEKDTVLISLPVFRGPWHIQQDQLGVLGLAKDDSVELHSSVHPSDIGLVPGRRAVWWAAQWA